jgi:hypothetical protein
VSKSRVKARTLAERMDRVVLVQAHVSGLLLFSAAVFAPAAWRSRVAPHTGFGRTAAVMLGAAALAGGVAAVGPWLWRLRIAAQRRLIAAALVGCAGGLVAILPSIGYTPLFGAQAALTAAVFTEVGTRKGALAWFWVCGVVLVATMFVYWRVFVPVSLPE